MKKSLFYLLALCSLCACANSEKTASEDSQYALVSIGTKVEKPLLDNITENGREVLNLYRFAAKEIDRIYLRQVGDPVGSAVSFYPSDMTESEFATLSEEARSPYTIVRRGSDGTLTPVWYHDEYSESITKICNYLRAASDITIVPSVKDYLLAKFSDLQSDDYSKSNAAWLAMESKMDLVIGPNEVKDDSQYGLKKSYSAYVLLRDPQRSAKLEKFAAMMPTLQASLPCPPEYKSFVPAVQKIYAVDELYCSGYADRGIKEIVISFPTDPALQASQGVKTLVMQNVVNYKFNAIINPISDILLSEGQTGQVTSTAFFYYNLFRELGHGLGVKKTLKGESVESVLGKYSADIEEAKGYILGMYLGAKMIAEHGVDEIVTPENLYCTAVVSMIRGGRLGSERAIGAGDVICYNYLRSHGALERSANGHYTVKYSAISAISEALISELLRLQAEGSFGEAEEFVGRYAKVGADLKDDFSRIGLEKVPIDIRYSFDW